MVLGLTVSPGAVLNPCTSCVNQWCYYPISQMVKWGLKEVRTLQPASVRARTERIYPYFPWLEWIIVRREKDFLNVKNNIF